MFFQQHEKPKVKLDSLSHLKIYLKSKIPTFNDFKVDKFDVSRLADGTPIVRVRVQLSFHKYKQWLYFGRLQDVVLDINSGIYEKESV